MRNREMKRWTAALEKMTPTQRQKLAAELTALDARPAAVTVVEGRLASVPTCPHCAAERVVKNGSARGLQRYKCRGCAKTFCALTGTPLAGLHMRGKWIEQAAALRDGLTLHQVADQLNIAVSTAHRWRHRFLSLPKAVQAQALVGIAEADETFFLRSNKGQRKGLGRPARKRGGKASKRGLSSEQVPVLVARDRAGSTADFILGADDAPHVVAALQPILARTSSFARTAARHWPPPPGPWASPTGRSTCPPVFASSPASITCRTSMPTTAGSRIGCADSRAWPRNTSTRTWAGSAPSSGRPTAG